MFTSKHIPDSDIRDDIIQRIQPFTAIPISNAAHVIVIGDKKADMYSLFISDRAGLQNIYVDCDGSVMIETLGRVPAIA